jgi:NAD(P)H-hydrate epimerase
MRCGAGLVTLGIPRSLNHAVIKIKPLEVMTLPLPQTPLGTLSLAAFSKIKDFCEKTDVQVIGPGLTRNPSTVKLIHRLIKESDNHLVVDADALNALAGHLKGLAGIKGRDRELVLTPHPGEMSRLSGKEIVFVQSHRVKIARDFARGFGLTLVLKGHKTIVTDHKGRLYINKTGNPGMASAGTGDVLSGVIGAFLAQGLSGFEAAKYAVYLHGLAGDLAAKEKTQLSLLASDIIDKLPAAIKLSS